MSRGFVREGDQEEHVIVPPRAALPEEVVNYVTPRGMELLLTEREALEKERLSLNEENEGEYRRRNNFLLAKLRLLNERITSARVINPEEQPRDEVRFGATVTFTVNQSENLQTFQIVGVDEADVKQSKIAFVAPIAVALTGGKEGEERIFVVGNEKRVLRIWKITYY